MRIKDKLKSFCPWWVKSSIRRLNRSGIILMYHRINDSSFDPHHLNVNVQHFEEQISVVKKYGKVVPLSQMARDLSKVNLGKDEIAFTFDDGFEDNFFNARPILEKNDIPATFYVPSEAVDHDQEFWWDRLSRILITEKLPENFNFVINNVHCQWKIDSSCQDNANSSGIMPTNDSVISKNQLFFSLWRLIRPLSFQQQNQLIDEILNWAQQPRSVKSGYLPMSLENLRQLSNSKLFEIGAHTAHHPYLSAFSPEEQELEILEGKQSLEKLINKEVTSFAYPFGEYTNDTLSILRRTSFKNACTVKNQPVQQNSNPFLLPRFMVMNWSGDQFELKLKEWLSSSFKG